MWLDPERLTAVIRSRPIHTSSNEMTKEQRPPSFAIVQMDDSDLDVPAVARLIAELLDAPQLAIAASRNRVL
jgi:hypothetical protein